MAAVGSVAYDPEQAGALCAAVLGLCRNYEEIKTNLEPNVKALQSDDAFAESDTKAEALEAVQNTFNALNKVGDRMGELEKAVSQVVATVEESAAMNIKSSQEAAELVAAAKRKAETADGKH